MRSLPVQYGTIRIASVAGERRRISVSGLAKARLLWLFRNFYILDFSVLNKKQQQLIAQMWNAGTIARSADASHDLIGTVEGYWPQLYPLSVPTPHGVRLVLPSGLRIPAIWAAMGVLLLGGAMGLGPKLRLTPPPRVAAAPARRVRSTATHLARASAELAPSVANPPAPATDASTFPPLHLPDAMAHDESSLNLQPPRPRVAVSTKALANPEVIMSVSVDSQGRAQAFQILQGNQKKGSAALNAARQLSFQPCSSSADCEHRLKFTDYGDASIVQKID